MTEEISLKEKLDKLGLRLDKLLVALDLNKKKEELSKLQAEATDPNLWNDQEKARKLLKNISDLSSNIKEIEDVTEVINTLRDLSSSGELDPEFIKEVAQSEKKLSTLELESFLSGDYDKKAAIVSIHAGQGGTEAMDWANILLRMYMRFCERKEWTTEVFDSTSGEEAGIKSVTFKVDGMYAYGFLKGEAGTHRLVRQSPFNADNLRQTSFALVEVLPELEEVDLPGIVIKDEDLDWQFTRSGGHGGQNVNKVSTAVRLTHLPSGIVVVAQTERFQEQNRKIALSLLRAKLWLRQKEVEKNKVKDIKGEYRPASWGNQIRSYVLHPYKMVKDLRTDIESSNPDSVLDGELDEFIEAELKIPS